MKWIRRSFLALSMLLAAAITADAQLSKASGAEKQPVVSCAECHMSQIASFEGTRMGRLMMAKSGSADQNACTACHGRSIAHEESGGDTKEGLITFSKKDKTPVVERNAICMQCHERSQRALWMGSTHEQAGLACTNCHTVMTSSPQSGHLKKGSAVETCGQCHTQRKAQQMRASHMPLGEGKMDCNSCHNPHGSPNEKLLVAASVNDVCYGCHTEKRGPYLWEHAPVVESCANCHDSHGSNHEKMLKVARPRLCQQCHDENRHPTQPQLATATRFVANRQCSHCHINIHGSNHTAGTTFTR